MSNSREEILRATTRLIEKQGYHATGLNQIVKESGAPKGSVYYYFPRGKEQIAEEAVERAGQQVCGRIRQHLSAVEDPAEAVRGFIHTIAHYVEESGFQAGGPLQTVSLETATGSEPINLACQAAYAHLLAAFQDKLEQGGFRSYRAADLAMFITAAVEGAILLSRTLHSGEPLRLTGDYLAETISMALSKEPGG